MMRLKHPITRRGAVRVLGITTLVTGMLGCVAPDDGAHVEDGAYDDEIDGGVHESDDGDEDSEEFEVEGEEQGLTIKVAADPTEPQAVGIGYTSNTQEFRNYCFSTRSLYTPVPGEGRSSFTQLTSVSSIEESLGISATAKASYGLFSANLKSSFSRDALSTSQSITTVYTNRSHVDTIGLDKTKTFRPATNMTPGSAQWLRDCGDYYVKDIQRGGEIYILAKMDFATESEKKAFEMSAGAQYAGVGGTVAASKASKSFAGRASIRLEAFQRGGEVARLGSAFSGTTGGGQALAAVNCSFNNMKACTDFLDRAIKYATGTGANDFPQNVKRAPGYLGYTLERWSDLAGFAGSPANVPTEVASARKTLYSLLKKELEVRSRIDALKRSNYFGGPSSFVNAVKAYDTQSTKNAGAISNAATLCFDALSPTPTASEISKCVNAVSSSGLAKAGYVAVPLDKLSTPLAVYSYRGRPDYFDEVTPGVGLWGNWGAWAMCPKGTWAVGYRMRVESPRGDGDDTALNGVEFDCQPWTRGAPRPVMLGEGLYGSWHGYARCSNGPMNGMNLRFERSQGKGDDAGATNLKGSCVSGQEIQAPGGLDQWGEFQGFQYCPAGTAVCGGRVRIEPSQGSGDDTALNGIELACCAY